MVKSDANSSLELKSFYYLIIKVSLTQEQLEKSTLSIRSYAKLENGASVELPEIKVKVCDISRLKLRIIYKIPFLKMIIIIVID